MHIAAHDDTHVITWGEHGGGKKKNRNLSFGTTETTESLYLTFWGGMSRHLELILLTARVLLRIYYPQ